MSDGYQMGDVSTDDTFAHLSIFVQRLVQEDDHEIFAWNPMQDEAIYKVSAEIEETQEGVQQPLIIRQGYTRGSRMTATTARGIVEEVLSRDMAREIWSASYDKALPITINPFDLSAVLPAVFFMFRYGHRRGKGSSSRPLARKKELRRNAGRRRLLNESRTCSWRNHTFVGFKDEVAKAILGDLLLCFCLENVKHVPAEREGAARAPVHTWQTGWIFPIVWQTCAMSPR